MPIHTHSPSADCICRPLTQAITIARRERLEREQNSPDVNNEALRAKLRAIRKSIAELPELDGRSADEILGYDEFGLPT